MSYHATTLYSVKEQYENKRKQALATVDGRKANLEARFPRLREIDLELSSTAPSILGAIFQKDQWAEAFEKIKQNNLALRAERAKILTDNGFPADYLTIHYSCEECQDTGFVSSKMCRCMKKALMLKECELSGLGHLIETQSFDTFDFSYYTGKDQEAIRQNYAFLKKYAETFTGKNDPSWLLIGPTGLGKTHLSTSVAKVLIERGFGVTYLSAQQLIAPFGRNAEENADELTKDILYGDCLIIDDLGTELNHEFPISVIYNVINTRLAGGKATIINTNLTQSELYKRYASRITSRLFGEYRPLLFSGQDIRMQKLLK